MKFYASVIPYRKYLTEMQIFFIFGKYCGKSKLNLIFFTIALVNIEDFFLKYAGIQGEYMTVTVDEKARAFLAKHNETTVYAYLGGCRT